jgi:hypothetical protein
MVGMNTVLWLLAVLLCAVPRALADAAPEEALPGSGILPGGARTQVRMVAETVTLTLRPNWTREDTELEAGVTAAFTMRNLGKVAESMQVRFPISDTYGGYSSGRIADFKVQVDGKTLQTATTRTPNPVDANLEPVLWATFPVSFPPGKDVRINVAYSLESTSYASVEHVGYILETGRGWNGTIGTADLIVKMPYPSDGDALVNASKAWNVLTTTPGGKQSGNEFRWRWQNLEPTAKDNFSLTVPKPSAWRAVWLAKARVKLEPQKYSGWTRLGAELHGVAAGRFGESALGAARDRAFARALQLAKNETRAKTAEAEVRMAMLLNNDEKDGLLEGNAYQTLYQRLLEVLRLDPDNSEAHSFLEQLQGFADSTPMQLTLPLLPPTLGSPGAVTGLEPAAVVKALATLAQLEPGTADKCALDKRIASRLDGSGYTVEAVYGYSSATGTASAPFERLNTALERYGRSWITPGWEVIARTDDLDQSWRFFANLDGSRRYGVSIRTSDAWYVVCFTQFVKR